MKTVLVTGANGQVGSALCRLGSSCGFEVMAYDSAQLDISNRDAVRSLLESVKPDFIVNAAAYTAVDKAEQEPERAYEVNALGPGHLAEMAAQLGAPMVHYSTDYVFDGSLNRPYRENDPVAPLGVYGRTKLDGEEAVRRSSPKHLILRISWVFALTGHNFPKTMIRLAGERPVLRVVADQHGSPTFADDVAKTTFLLLGKSLDEAGSPFPWGQTFHYTGGEPCSWYEFARYVINQAVEAGLINQNPEIHPVSTAEYPTPAARPANSRLDCGAIFRAFRDLPQPQWQEGVKSLIQGLVRGS